MSLILRNIMFTIVVPGAGAVLLPWLILGRGSAATPVPGTWPAVAVIAAGAGLYVWCLSLFGRVGRGTPGPWDAPRALVTVGPYRWMRNPIYVSALLVVLGEAWLFGSVSLLLYAVAMAIGFHLFVVGYEEPTLRRNFGASYAAYRQSVPRWILRRPRTPQR